MKDQMTDAEIAEAIVKLVKGIRWSTVILMFGLFNTILGLYYAYDYIFFDGGIGDMTKGVMLFGFSSTGLMVGGLMRDYDS